MGIVLSIEMLRRNFFWLVLVTVKVYNHVHNIVYSEAYRPESLFFRVPFHKRFLSFLDEVLKRAS